MPYLVEIMKSSINKEVVIKIGLKVVIIRFFKKIKSWEGGIVGKEEHKQRHQSQNVYQSLSNTQIMELF